MKNSLSELSPEKRALLAQLLKEEGVNLVPAQTIARRTADGPAPLSYAQQRLWFLHQFQQDEGGIYSVPCVAYLRGELHVPFLEQAFTEILRRHEALRTSFSEEQGRPAQRIHPAEPVRIQIIDLAERRDEKHGEALTRLIRDQVRAPFDLGRTPLLRVVLLRLEAEEHILIVVMHHIASDGWSLSVLNRELGRLYDAYCQGKSSPLEELPIQYADYAIWQREWLQGEVLNRQLEYWRKQLDGCKAPDLPTDYARPALLSQRGASREITVSAGLTRKLKQLSQSAGVTLYVALLAAFQMLMHLYTGQDDITTGSPIAGRVRPELESLIGFFVNTLVLRNDLGQDPTFFELLQRTKKVTLEAYANQDVPFEKLVEELHPERDMSRTPFFQVMFAWENTEQVKLLLSGLEVTQHTFLPNSAEDGTAKFDLALQLCEAGGEIRGELEYNRDLFDPSTISAMSRNFTALLQAMADDPGRHISDVSLLSQEDQDTEKNQSQPDARPETPFGEMFALHAKDNPDARALISREGILSYGELYRLADEFALRLQSLGVKSGDRVAICTEQARNLVIAALGILKSGAVVVPIAPAEARLREISILNDSGAAWIVTEEQFKERFPEHPGRRILIDGREEPGQAAYGRGLSGQTNLGDDACIIYQSNALGYPAGTPVPHGALRGPAFGKGLDIQSSDTVALEISFFQEAACLDVFTALASGACIVEIPSEPPLPPRKFAMLLRDNAATILMTSAAVLQRLSSDFPWALKNLRLIICSDEIGDLERLRKHLKPEIVNRVYGAYASLDTGGRTMLFPLEMPFENTVRDLYLAQGNKLSIVDPRGRPVPAGIHGEICIHKAVTLKNSKAASMANNTTQAACRTGEFGRWRKDGSLEFRGRRDRRVNIRGVRIYPQEIEMALVQYPGIGEAVVVPRRVQGLRGLGLIGLLTSREGALIELEDLRTFLKNKLPSALVPETFKVVDAIPRSGAGEPDYEAIARNLESQESVAPAYVAPRNETERQIADIWSLVLGGSHVGIHDNFFHRGGHSLLATQLAARMSDAFRIDVPLRRIFESPTVAGMGKLVEQLLQTEGKSRLPRITAAPRNARTFETSLN